MSDNDAYLKQLEERIDVLEKRLNKVEKLSVQNNGNIISIANTISELTSRLLVPSKIRAAMKQIKVKGGKNGLS